MTKEEIAAHMKKINNMTQLEMARMWRFSPPGHMYFNTTLSFSEAFNKRFEELGGFTPKISKRLGW